MAWRIHDSVKRGEIDNRERGVVCGRIWLDGFEEPVILELEGNACRDLAGCLLTFENPGKTLAMRQDADMNTEQRGTIGDLTASRKVRVFEIPFEQAYKRLKQKPPVPEHMANCLYLEWFSEANGRVVIESTDYRLTVSAPLWTLTAAEEEQRAREAAEGVLRLHEQLRTSNSAIALIRLCRGLEEGWAQDEDLSAFVEEFRITGAKLAGALNSLAYGRNQREGAFTVAHLKRALGHLHAYQAALERVAPRRPLPPDTLGSYRKELFENREEILRRMDEFRERP